MSTPDTLYHIISKQMYVIGTDDPIAVSGAQIIQKMSEDPWNPIFGLGATLFGAVIGWNLYFINRFRKNDSISIENLGVLLTALLGGSVLTYFGKSMLMFGLYGIGLGLGFFGYLIFLIWLSKRSGVPPEYSFPMFFLKPPEGQHPMKYVYDEKKDNID